VAAINRNEERKQARVMRWSTLRAVRQLVPQLEALFHVPNGGKRDAFTGVQMLALGVKRDVPDLLLPIPSAGCHGLAIEMKTDIGQLWPHQQRWFEILTAAHWPCVVCRSADEARADLAD
jgi:hypothetical protein